MLALLACSALMAVRIDAPPADPHQAYQEARAKAGRSPDDQVKLALWCEAHGLTAERLHHLTLAVLADPRNAAARGLMGLVSYDGRWTRPEVLADKLKADLDHAATLKEYSAKRLKTAYTADAQLALGIWCDEHGLKDQARAHITAVTRLDPTRENAWKRLGYKKHDGRWVTDAQLAAVKADTEAQKAANKKWKPVLERYKTMLGQPSRRAEAEAALTEVTDPRAVPMIGKVFGSSGATQARAVQLLGQVESPMASKMLASMAVFSKSAEVRRVAVETLKGRDPRDFVRLWIALIRKPIKYEVRPVGGPGSPGSLFVEGQKANVRRIYAPPSLPTIPYMPQAMIGYDGNGLPVIRQPLGNIEGNQRISTSQFSALAAADQESRNRAAATGSQLLAGDGFGGAESRQITGILSGLLDPYKNILNINNLSASQARFYRPIYSREIDIPIGEMVRETQVAAVVAQQQLAADVATLDRTNVAIRQSNEPVLQALKSVTGGDLGDDSAAWDRWWTEREGYAFMTSQESTKPIFFEEVPLAYTPQAGAIVSIGPVVGFARGHSCFGAGTRVRTIDGDRAIESIRAGDIVLVQDTKSGGLAYHPVVTAYHNPPSPTLRVAIEGESIVVTGIHRFWKAGKGWAMARDLKVGDTIRTLGDVARVESIADDRTQPVFNLEVADGHSFLVGKLGALVHDNSLVEATPEPFDAAN